MHKPHFLYSWRLVATDKTPAGKRHDLSLREKIAHLLIKKIRTTDAKLFLVKLQKEDKRSYSSIHTIRGVLRPAFATAV